MPLVLLRLLLSTSSFAEVIVQWQEGANATLLEIQSKFVWWEAACGCTASETPSGRLRFGKLDSSCVLYAVRLKTMGGHMGANGHELLSFNLDSPVVCPAFCQHKDASCGIGVNVSTADQ